MTQPQPGEYVWYVSYGSNLLRERFLAYILGGTAPGGKRANHGCSDPSLPLRDEPVDIPAGLYFGPYTRSDAQSTVYEGGVAFIDPEEEGKTTLARAYLITGLQFFEVMVQENGWDTPPEYSGSAEDMQYDEARMVHPEATLNEVVGAHYSRPLYLGDLDNCPLLSFTSPRRSRETRQPSELYLRTMSVGLRQSRGIGSAAIASYLSELPGITGNYTHDELHTIAGSQTVA